jgi:hypothetical protein
MTEPRIESLTDVLANRQLPTVGLWNRLEGRPRTTDFDRALRAEVRDPLWMLTRQWQLGEFRGADAGSPVTAQYSLTATTPTRFAPSTNGTAENLTPDRPLETFAERRALPFAFGSDRISFDLRLAIGRRWMKLIGQDLVLQLLDARQQYIGLYPIALPDPDDDADTARTSHPEVWAAMQAMAGRRMDGYELYKHIKGGHRASDGITGLAALSAGSFDALGTKLVAWFDALIDQPAGDAAWDPRRLEHRFSVSGAAPGGARVLTAQEYPGGTLDWQDFSLDTGRSVGGVGAVPAPITRTVFPAQVRFSGMPLPRWWAVEDGKTNFAAVKPDSTDLARLIFLEFALVYGNDWYQLACDLPAGTLAQINGVAVTDVFGQRQWVTPAGVGDPAVGETKDWQRWSMFTLDTVGPVDPTAPVPVNTGMLLPPSVPKVANGPVLEEVWLVRDEHADLVWGIEQTVRTATGESRRGNEISAEVLAHRTRLFPPPARDGALAPIAYEAMNFIPDNWIPFIPVHTDDLNRKIQLQRAAMPSAVGPTVGVPPRTDLLREGLDAGRQYFVNQEEVPVVGTRMTVAYNRTRWRDGRVVVWLSAQRGVGRGEGSSGLAFDQLVDTGQQ